MKPFFILIALFYCWIPNWGKSLYPLLPYPQKITYTDKQLVLDKLYLDTTEEISQHWKEWLQNINATLTPAQTDETIKIKIKGSLPEIPIPSDESYKLSITEKQIEVTATSSTGAYRALQTIQQLTTYAKNNRSYCLPTCEIIDWPAFRIRGFMLDVGRTYISINELKKEIELLSKFKINVFH